MGKKPKGRGAKDAPLEERWGACARQDHAACGGVVRGRKLLGTIRGNLLCKWCLQGKVTSDAGAAGSEEEYAPPSERQGPGPESAFGFERAARAMWLAFGSAKPKAFFATTSHFTEMLLCADCGLTAPRKGVAGRPAGAVSCASPVRRAPHRRTSFASHRTRRDPSYVSIRRD
jgi:hypothetical protein